LVLQSDDLHSVGEWGAVGSGIGCRVMSLIRANAYLEYTGIFDTVSRLVSRIKRFSAPKYHRTQAF
jgi:hypothetical protein